MTDVSLPILCLNKKLKKSNTLSIKQKPKVTARRRKKTLSIHLFLTASSFQSETKFFLPYVTSMNPSVQELFMVLY